MATLLLAEDEPDIQDLIRVLLEREGHAVVTCAAGSEVMPALARAKPDAVLLDVMMPGMDGHTVMMQMAGDPALRAIPVLIVSALESSADLFTKFPQVRGFLPKPFPPARLTEMVKQALQPLVKGDAHV
jgi:CheY-like chemotaxis protein